jgi:transcriptional regulator with XRE-family HTH domain
MKKKDHSETVKSLLSRNLRQLRVDSGLSQAELAKKAGISIPYLGAVERGDKWPSPTTLAALAHSLGLEPYVLLLPEGMSSKEIKKFMVKLEKDILAVAGKSLKQLGSIVKEGGSGKKGD